MPIEGDFVAYDEEYKEFYHTEGCMEYAVGNREWKTGEIQTGKIRYLPKTEAWRIKSKLENK